MICEVKYDNVVRSENYWVGCSIWWCYTCFRDRKERTDILSYRDILKWRILKLFRTLENSIGSLSTRLLFYAPINKNFSLQHALVIPRARRVPRIPQIFPKEHLHLTKKCRENKVSIDILLNLKHTALCLQWFSLIQHPRLCNMRLRAISAVTTVEEYYPSHVVPFCFQGPYGVEASCCVSWVDVSSEGCLDAAQVRRRAVRHVQLGMGWSEGVGRHGEMFLSKYFTRSEMEQLIWMSWENVSYRRILGWSFSKYPIIYGPQTDQGSHRRSQIWSLD